MKKTFVVFVLLLTGIIITACSFNPLGFMQDKIEITIDNQTADNICDIYISPESREDWGNDLLAKDKSLAAGLKQTFEVNKGTYDLLVYNCSGIPMHSLSNVQQTTTVVVGGANLQPITIENRTEIEICFVFIAPTINEEWGEDQLGGVESILPEKQRIFYIPTGDYDLRAENCDQEAISEVFDFSVNSPSTWIVER